MNNPAANFLSIFNGQRFWVDGGGGGVLVTHFSAISFFCGGCVWILWFFWLMAIYHHYWR